MRIIPHFTLCAGLFLLAFLQLHAQYPDNKWLLGYSTIDSMNNGFGLVQLDFSNNQVAVGDEMEVQIDLDRNISIISTPTGDSILFYFNGLQVNNGGHELAVNGEDMYTGYSSLGYNVTQGSLVLPWPEQENTQFLLMSMFAERNDTLRRRTGYELNYSIIITEPEIEVIEKNIVLEQGSLHAGQLTATRHANGRDWWIIWPYWDSNRYMRFLFTPQGLERQEDQYLSIGIRSGAGQSRFSPDGRYFMMFNGINPTDGDFFDLYDFDRCTGMLSNHRHYNLPDNGGGAGIAVSQNSRYAYIFSTGYVLQLDLWADDPVESLDTVAVYDGVIDPLPSQFNNAQLARDGKIYMSSVNALRKLHVMDYPNRRGVACNVRQRGIQLPVWMSFGVPNFPFHRLGPLDGSPCDTLGIDNIPLASFRSDQDSSDYRNFFFQDLSTYEPATWSWSFGDGSMSQDTSPVHTYAQDGSYEVCLTVSNEYGSHTSCDTLHLGVVSSTEVVAPQIAWQLFPNPAQDYFTFNLLDYYPRAAYLALYNSMSQQVKRERIFAGWNTVDVANLPAGVYFWDFQDAGRQLAGGRVVKVE